LQLGSTDTMVRVWVAGKTVTHGSCLTSRCCPAWQLIRPIIAVLCDSLLCGWAVWLDYNKGSLLFIYLLQTYYIRQ